MILISLNYPFYELDNLHLAAILLTEYILSTHQQNYLITLPPKHYLYFCKFLRD